jgi:arabinose-5-phosphate isomerase
MLATSDDISNITAKEIMSKNPKTITSDSMAIEARKLMESSEISQLIVLKNNKYAGVIHIHDLIREGII